MKTVLLTLFAAVCVSSGQNVVTRLDGKSAYVAEKPAQRAMTVAASADAAQAAALAAAKEAAWQQAFSSATNLCRRILGLTVNTGAEFKTRAAEIAMTAIIKADAGTISANDLSALNARLFALDILSR